MALLPLGSWNTQEPYHDIYSMPNISKADYHQKLLCQSPPNGDTGSQDILLKKIKRQDF